MVPDGYEYLWDWFIEMCGPERLSYQEIDAWQRVMGVTLEAWEVRALRAMDAPRHQERKNTSIEATPANLKATFTRLQTMSQGYRKTRVK